MLPYHSFKRTKSILGYWNNLLNLKLKSKTNQNKARQLYGCNKTKVHTRSLSDYSTRNLGLGVQIFEFNKRLEGGVAGLYKVLCVG